MLDIWVRVCADSRLYLSDYSPTRIPTILGLDLCRARIVLILRVK